MEKRELPDGWEWARLDSCATISDRDHRTPKYQKAGYPLISPSMFTETGIDFSCAKYVGEDELDYFERKCKPTMGDILFSRIGTIGEARIINFDLKFVALHSIALIKPNHKVIDSKFLLYLLNSQIIKRQAFEGIRSISVPDLGLRKIEQFILPLPPLPVQRHIVEILEQADALRHLRAQADAETQKLLQSVFYEMFGDPVRNEKGWEVVEFDKIITQTRNGLYKPDSFYGTGIPIVRMYNIFNNQFDMATFHLITVSEEEYQQYRLDPGDIILNRVNSLIWLGKCAVVPNDIGRVVFESKNIRIKIRNDIANPHYIVHYLSTPKGRSEILKKSKNAVNQSTINNDDLRKFEIVLPPLELQEQFAKVISEINQIRLQQAEIKFEIENLFDGLMTKAFTGELN